VPQMPAHVKGVINLRGKVIPVVCLRSKFGMTPEEYSSRTCIIVVQVAGSSGAFLVGLVVDGVTEVLNITAAEIEDTPDFGAVNQPSYLLCMAKIKGQVKILLDIDQVMEVNELMDLPSLKAA
jgi:purine-binding chemotaxis protein CheW